MLDKFVEATLLTFAVLGGVMAAVSGLAATVALVANLGEPDVGERVSRWVDLGVALGWVAGAPVALMALVLRLADLTSSS